MKRSLALALFLTLAGSVFAQTASDTSTKKSSSKSSRAVPSGYQELKDAIAAQQQQIQQLQQQVASRDQAIQQLQQQAAAASAAAQAASQQAASDASKEGGQISAADEQLGNLKHEVTDLRSLTATQADALQDTQKRVSYLEAPNSLAFKGITITPGGFLAGETVWRPHATIGGLNTQLNGIPFSSAAQARQSEFYGSGRQSRLSMLAQGKLANINLSGYVEADFLSAGVTSNNNQSNSYTLRQRQAWAQAATHSGWTFTGGQMWSLVTETKVGLDNRTEATPLQIDPQYTAGFSWARQYGFRVTKNFQNKVWAGVSVEDSQELLTASGASSNFVIGGPGNLGGLYNNQANYSSNYSPDFVAKLAFQPGFGHYEVFGVASSFRERVYPGATATVPTVAGATNNVIWGGGWGVNGRWLMAQKKVEFALHYLAGNGVGRYGDATLPDVTVYSNGYEHLLRSQQALASLEFHLKQWDWYFYGGGEYVGRNANLSATGKPVGYGSPFFNNTGCGTETLPTASTGYGPGALGSCVGQTKSVIEGTAGFWYKPYNGPKGRLQMGLQYSYLSRYAWVGYGVAPYPVPYPYPSGTIAPAAIENMIFTSFRYYLP